eukprot:6198566-Pleurochrysis_carterae.AAC.1
MALSSSRMRWWRSQKIARTFSSRRSVSSRALRTSSRAFQDLRRKGDERRDGKLAYNNNSLQTHALHIAPSPLRPYSPSFQVRFPDGVHRFFKYDAVLAEALRQSDSTNTMATPVTVELLEVMATAAIDKVHDRPQGIRYRQAHTLEGCQPLPPTRTSRRTRPRWRRTIPMTRSRCAVK